MLLNEILNFESENIFVKNKYIALGINTFQGNANRTKFYKGNFQIVGMNYQSNGSLIIIGASSSGKSVLQKRIIDQRSMINDRPMLMIDTQGVDHRLLKQANLKFTPLFYDFGEKPLSHKNIILYTPVFVKNLAKEEDTIFGLALTDLDTLDLMSSNLTHSGIQEFFKIRSRSERNRLIMQKPNIFYQEFNKIKASHSEKQETLLDYEEDSLINYSIKGQMMTTLDWWKGYEPSDDEKNDYESKEEFNMKKRPPYFVEAKSKYHIPTFWQMFDKKMKIVIQFMDAKIHREGMSIYGGYMLKNVYQYADMNKKKYGMKFFGIDTYIEESNLFIDEDEKKQKKGCNYYITEMICRGFKNEIWICSNFQKIFGINKDIKEFLTMGSQPVIIGQITSSDKKYLSEIFPQLNNINLRKCEELPEYLQWGANEFVIFYNQNEYDTFVPYPSLSKMHERGK